MDNTKLKESKDKLINIALSLWPDIDLSPGTVANEFIIGMASLGYAIISEDIDKFADKMYLNTILENPDDADTSLVDAIVSNFFISRSSGSKAIGMVKVIVNEEKNYTISKETKFETSTGLVYYPIEDSEITPDKLYKEDNNYMLLVNVIAEEVGTKYMIAANTPLATLLAGGNLVSAIALNDFTAASEEESNKDLLNRVKNTLGISGLSNKQSIETLLKNQFEQISQMSIIGYNDREMQRDTNNIGIKVGGKVDIYIKTNNSPISKTIELETDNNGQIKLYEAIDYIPILRITGIADINHPLDIKHDFTLSLKDANKGKYYRFSSKEELILTTNLILRKMLVSFDYAPYIADTQNYVDNDNIRYLRADTLIKSFMPCFVKLKINYRASNNLSTEIINKLLSFINKYNKNELYASDIVDEIYTLNIDNIELPINMIGTFYKPDMNISIVESNNKITIGDNFDLGISKKTYRFFITASDISLNKV